MKCLYTILFTIGRINLTHIYTWHMFAGVIWNIYYMWIMFDAIIWLIFICERCLLNKSDKYLSLICWAKAGLTWPILRHVTSLPKAGYIKQNIRTWRYLLLAGITWQLFEHDTWFVYVWKLSQTMLKLFRQQLNYLIHFEQSPRRMVSIFKHSLYIYKMEIRSCSILYTVHYGSNYET
jgi:hypothetical protein